MANKNETSPKDYDRWGKTCVKFTDNAPKKETKTPKKAVKTTKKGK
jgi:hypothetical protein